MERELRNKNILAALRRVGSHPLLWIAIAAFIAWRGYSMYAPHVARVESDGEGRLVVSGRNFGTARGDSALVYSVGDQDIEIDVNEWSNDRIVARLRGEVVSGSVSVERAFWFFHWPSAAAALVIPERGLPSKPFGYAVPVQAGSPWPTFRRNPRNTGESPIPAAYGGDAPWSFRTAEAVRSTPVIDERGVVYFGSDDHNFYAVSPDGSELWRYHTGGVIDSSAALLRAEDGDTAPTAVVGSSDGYMYRLATNGETRRDAEREVWVFDARVASAARHGNRFDGGVTVGHDGTLYAANANASYYAVSRKGDLRWTLDTQGGNRAAGALGSDGTLFWTSHDGYIRAVNPNGSEKWSAGTWGAIAASAAIGSDGTVYVGSFDSYLYALDPESGSTRWTFKTGDHIVSSAAVGHDRDDRTDAVYVGSTDGHLYAVSPKGELLWKYDTGDPIRSSPAIGRGPGGDGPGIVYVGSGNGRLYALNAVDGKRRWSFDTTVADPHLRERNDLNGSVALGRNGVYIGSDSGYLWYVPYDYCLHAADERCSTSPGEDLPSDVAKVFYVSPGGTTYFDDPPPIASATVITLRLLVRKRARTVEARFCNTPVVCSASDIGIEVDPPIEFRVQPSADGRHVHIIPEEMLEPGRTYRIRAEGVYYTGGFAFGNLTIGGSRDGQFSGGVTLRTKASAVPAPLSPRADEVPAFVWTRITLPLPSMLTSFNATARDGTEWIVSIVDARPRGDGSGDLIAWGIGARRDGKGGLVADPDSTATLALTGTYSGNNVALFARAFQADIGGIPVPVEQLHIRGELDSNLEVQAGASLFAEADALSVPGFGTSLVAMGLANRVYDKLVASGTYMTRPYPRAGTANKRPRGLRVSFVEYAQATDRLPGQVVAHFRLPGRAPSYKRADHRFGILLIDRARGEVVPLDYHQQVSASADPEGEISQVVLTIPSGEELSRDLGIIVLVDSFPIHREKLTYRPQAK